MPCETWLASFHICTELAALVGPLRICSLEIGLRTTKSCTTYQIPSILHYNKRRRTVVRWSYCMAQWRHSRCAQACAPVVPLPRLARDFAPQSCRWQERPNTRPFHWKVKASPFYRAVPSPIYISAIFSNNLHLHEHWQRPPLNL